MDPQASRTSSSTVPLRHAARVTAAVGALKQRQDRTARARRSAFPSQTRSRQGSRATHLGRKTGFWARCSRSSGEVESELTYRST